MSLLFVSQAKYFFQPHNLLFNSVHFIILASHALPWTCHQRTYNVFSLLCWWYQAVHYPKPFCSGTPYQICPSLTGLGVKVFLFLVLGLTNWLFMTIRHLHKTYFYHLKNISKLFLCLILSDCTCTLSPLRLTTRSCHSHIHQRPCPLYQQELVAPKVSTHTIRPASTWFIRNLQC